VETLEATSPNSETISVPGLILSKWSRRRVNSPGRSRSRSIASRIFRLLTALSAFELNVGNGVSFRRMSKLLAAFGQSITDALQILVDCGRIRDRKTAVTEGSDDLIPSPEKNAVLVDHEV
jgi:hypothetical protein